MMRTVVGGEGLAFGSVDGAVRWKLSWLGSGVRAYGLGGEM